MQLRSLMDKVQGNLGNRVTGKIGNVSVDVATLAAINEAIKQLPINATPEYAERILQLQLIEGTFTYAFPTKDISDVSVEILEIRNLQLYDTDEERYPISMELGAVFDSIHDYVRTNKDPGRPTHVMRYGGKLFFAPTPDDYYTLYIRALCMLAALTSSQYNETISIESEWHYVVECFATSYLYTKLQQAQLASFWHTLYQDSRKEVEHVHEKEQALRDNGFRGAAFPEDNPFIKRLPRG